MLKLYTKWDYLTEDYRKWSFPLLRGLHFMAEEGLASCYQIVDDLDVCDVAIFPADVGQFFLRAQEQAVYDFVAEANRHGIPIWLFSGNDLGLTLPFEGTKTFRWGGFHSRLPDSSVVMPSFIEDPYKSHLDGDFTPLHKPAAPEIGFVGHARSGLLKYCKEFIVHYRSYERKLVKASAADDQPFYPSGGRRANYLKILSRDRRLRCNFVLRNRYMAGAKSDADKQRTRLEFYENMERHLYTLCMRGVGNFSVRFYETLATGRIPILVDTDCRLPLHKQIDWHRHAVIIDEKEVRNLPDHLVSFHESKTEEQMVAIQVANRRLWQKTLCRVGYFRRIHDLFNPNRL